MFLAVGRHPVAGLLAAIAGVGCGFTANLLIVTTDVLLSGSAPRRQSPSMPFARQRDRQLVLYGDFSDRSDARRRTDHR